MVKMLNLATLANSLLRVTLDVANVVTEIFSEMFLTRIAAEMAQN